MFVVTTLTCLAPAAAPTPADAVKPLPVSHLCSTVRCAYENSTYGLSVKVKTPYIRIDSSHTPSHLHAEGLTIVPLIVRIVRTLVVRVSTSIHKLYTVSQSLQLNRHK
jgi:hypothetical protein